MEIPGEVKIGYTNYNVNIIEGNVVDDNKVCYGAISFDDGEIKLSNLYNDDLKKCTFIHECIHGIDNAMEIDLDEDQVRKLGKGIYQFIKDNPNIFQEKRTGGCCNHEFREQFSGEEINQNKVELINISVNK